MKLGSELQTVFKMVRKEEIPSGFDAVGLVTNLEQDKRKGQVHALCDCLT